MLTMRKRLQHSVLQTFILNVHRIEIYDFNKVKFFKYHNLSVFTEYDRF